MKKLKVIILAGGKGVRFGTAKQFVKIYNIPLFVYTLKQFSNFDKILVIPQKYYKYTLNLIKKYNISNIIIIKGGNTRQASVFNALKYLNKEKFNGYIAITDACRPFVTKKIIKKGFKYLDDYDAVVSVIKAINTSCVSYDNKYLDDFIDRTNQYNLLMPQFFYFKTIYMAHKYFNKKIKNATDDANLFFKMWDKKIKMMKITWKEGLKLTYLNQLPSFNLLLYKKRREIMEYGK